ncbi:MAG: hypothetical protein EZS28_022950, partial [Streblomastix strix]
MGNKQSKLSGTPKYEDFIIIKELSRGSYGRVLQVSLKLMPEKEIVMKRLPFLEKQDKKAANEEVSVLKKVQSQYTVRFVEAFTFEQDLCVIMEFCSGGNLRKLMEQMKDWSF